MRFVIDRETWFRGNGRDSSKLLDEYGNRCCFGFVGQQCGIPDGDLLNKVAAHNVLENYGAWPFAFEPGLARFNEPDWVYDAYGVNDNENITDAEREQKLIELAAANGHEFEFVGGPGKEQS